MKNLEPLRNVKNYLGIFNFRDLKKIRIKQYPSYFILKRKHIFLAVAIYINDIYICDPIGILESDNILKYFPVLCFDKNIYITKRLQHDQNLHYICLLFIAKMSKNKGFDNFINLFSTNLKTNYKIIRKLFKSI